MPLPRGLRRILCVAGLALWAGGAGAQGNGLVQDQLEDRFRTPLVTLDQDRLFVQSAFGTRLQRELEQARAELGAENRQIEAALIAEEQGLTVERDTVPPAEFAQMAAAFDTKVQRIRQEQDRKSALLQERLEDQRAEFLNAVGPVLIDLLQDRGAVGIIDRNAVLLSFEGLDITDDAIALIDARLGDGEMSAPAGDTGTVPTQTEN